MLEDIEKTVVPTTFGLFEYIHMPFGLRNVTATFQQFMDNIFMNTECVFIYHVRQMFIYQFPQPTDYKSFRSSWNW